MIHILGFKKVFLILLLTVGGGALFVLNTYYLTPQSNKLEKELSINEAAASKLDNKIVSLSTNHARFQDQKVSFDLIEQTGFFNKQDRLEVRRLITELKERSKLTSVRFQMSAANVQANERAQEIDHKLLRTEVSYDLAAIEDTDIYNFLFMINHGFPGIVDINSLVIDRSEKLTQQTLREIGSGKLVPLVNAKLKTVWWTLVPADSVEMNSPQSLTEGF